MTNAASASGRLPVPRAYLVWGLLALIQLALIALPLADRVDVQRNGERVQLELIPVDPRDLLRGDYVIINLAIGRVSIDVEGADTVRAGDTVYVGLTAQGESPPGPAVIARDRAGAGRLALAGTVVSVSGTEVRIDYGIDAFFVPEGEGRKIERLDASRVLLEVAITGDGRSLPIRLLIDGQAFRSDAIF
ncbi:GDYXXLXY domain-containing protein [Roseibium sp.]